MKGEYDFDINDIGNSVTQLQEVAGEICLNPGNFGINRDVTLKGKVAGDYVTAVDEKIEEMMKPDLLDLIPDSQFLGEEGKYQDEDKRFVWIVDPIDGTAIYSMEGEYYSCSIALVDRKQSGNHFNVKGSVPFGSVYQPVNGRQFIRTPTELSVIERAVISCPDDSPPTLKMLKRIPQPSQSKCFGEYRGCAYAPSRSYHKFPGLEERIANIFTPFEAPFLKRTYNMKDAKPASGSAALFCCDIADGNNHFAVMFDQKAWDVAVGALYARDAGCQVLLFDDDCEIMPPSQDIEEIIAGCNKKTSINIGVFANENVAEDVLERFNGVPK